MTDVDGAGPPPAGHAHSDLVVVGLGGSAGSIPSFREFFRNVPSDSGMAYVVILHLSPEYESHLAEVIQSAASIPVMQVSETVEVEPNRVYVIPPNRSLVMNDGTLTVSEITRHEERRAPVDIFFRTLADTHDAHAICVVLSGTGADGSMGLRRIKEYNGLVLVQEPTEAQFDEMPCNSIATGMVDFIVPVAEMPARIMAYRNQLNAGPLISTVRDNSDEQALIDIFTSLRMRTGHDFTNYKRATVLRRIERRLVVRDMTQLSHYARFLRERPDEAEALRRELLISVTNFFRDPAVFEKLEQTVIPKLLESKGPQDHLRVWVAGCATGEEAYSIAMQLTDAAADLPNAPNIQIFATDLDADAIAKARNGFYTNTEIADIPPQRLRRYFVKDREGYRIRRELREIVLFAHHNLLEDPPFSHVDFISCRNVLIYLNRTAQQRAMEVLHFALEPGGYLLLGTAESADSAGQLFATVDKESHIYQTRATGRVTTTIPVPTYLTVSSDLRNAGATGIETRHEPRTRFAPLDLHQRLLEEYAPPSLIVDDQYKIVHLSERAGRYLQFAAGEASLNLLQRVRPELRSDLRTALFQSAQKRATIAARGVVVHTGEQRETINIIVKPALRDGDPTRGFFLVVFEGAAENGDAPIPDISAAEPVAQQLDEELLRLEAQMRISIEQYEVQAEESRASNEELQAINEELRSTAEELETSQEELQSVNEELQTVNQELKIKIDEISHASNDMRNLMSSTEIGTIFVDRALRVKLFTPRSSDVFTLIPADVGRPLLDINSKLTAGGLQNDLERVLARLQTIEREVETRDGHWHLMRLLPYRTAEDRIDGVVVTFVDITERKRTEEALRRSREELEQRVADRTAELRQATAMLQPIVDSSPLAIIAIDAQRNVMTWNASAERMFGVRAHAILGKPLADAADGAAEVQRILLEALTAGGLPHSHEIVLRRDDASSLTVSIFPALLPAADGDVHAVMGLLHDITDRRRMEQERELLLQRIVTGQENERQRLARELHDELGQHLTALKVGLEAQPGGTNVQRMMNIVGEIDRSLDRLTLELRPPALDDVGLHGAIASLIEQFTSASGIHVDMHSTAVTERLPAVIETTLYRVLQEALTNTWKHATARNVSVIVERQAEQIQLIVEDDGSGFETSEMANDSARDRFGLLGMRERVSLIGGTFSIESGLGRGTTIYVRVPLPNHSS